MGKVHVLTTPPMAGPVLPQTADYICRRLSRPIEAYPVQIRREMIAEGKCPESVTLKMLLGFEDHSPDYTEEVGQKIIAYIEETFDGAKTTAGLIRHIAHRLTQ